MRFFPTEFETFVKMRSISNREYFEHIQCSRGYIGTRVNDFDV
jgi:hypothetical protein